MSSVHTYTTVRRLTARLSTKDKDDHRRNIANEHVARRKREFGCCKICGETDVRCLTFHHVDPKQKKFNISTSGQKRLLTDTIDAEIAKCILVCENCHRKIHNPLPEDNFSEEILEPLGFLKEHTTLTPFFR